MVEEVQYFGYGANRSPEMMEAIVGRLPEGYPAKISGFELCVETWQDIPEHARRMLSNSWDPTFRSYCVRPSGNLRSSVKGIVWKITREERRLIDNWELTGTWYKVFVLQYQLSKEEAVQIEIQVIEDPNVKKVFSGNRYKTFLNSKRKMLEVARKTRESYLHRKVFVERT